MREATSPGHTRSLSAHGGAVLEPRQPSQPGAVLGPLAERERAAGDRASLPAPSCRELGPGALECCAASPRRRPKDPSARRGRTGDKEAPGRDEESLGGGGGVRTPGPPAAAAGSGRVAHTGSPGSQPWPGEGAPAAPALASSLRPRGRERATRLGPAAAAPPSPALSALPGAAAAASSAPAPPPAPRKSPPRTGALGSAGGKTRDSPKTPRCGDLKQPSQSFLWIKKIYDFLFLGGAEEKERKISGDLQGRKGDVTRGYVFSTLQTSCSTL